MPETSSAKLPVRSSHTVLYCERWEECIAFYRDILGFSVVFTNEIFVEVQPATGARIGLMNASRTRWPASCSESFILSFRVANIDETHQSLQRELSGIGAIEDHPWGARLFEIKDPDGRRIEFWSDADKGFDAYTLIEPKSTTNLL
jgi:catechol 2,3-dioxygenase-like lactoylglutathione lyase family enzyme